MSTVVLMQKSPRLVIREAVQVRCEALYLNRAQTDACVEHAIALYSEFKRSTAYSIEEGKLLAARLAKHNCTDPAVA